MGLFGTKTKVCQTHQQSSRRLTKSQSDYEPPLIDDLKPQPAADSVAKSVVDVEKEINHTRTSDYGKSIKDLVSHTDADLSRSNIVEPRPSAAASAVATAFKKFLQATTAVTTLPTYPSPDYAHETPAPSSNKDTGGKHPKPHYKPIRYESTRAPDVWKVEHAPSPSTSSKPPRFPTSPPKPLRTNYKPNDASRKSSHHRGLPNSSHYRGLHQPSVVPKKGGEISEGGKDGIVAKTPRPATSSSGIKKTSMDTSTVPSPSQCSCLEVGVSDGDDEKNDKCLATVPPPNRDAVSTFSRCISSVSQHFRSHSTRKIRSTPPDMLTKNDSLVVSESEDSESVQILQASANRKAIELFDEERETLTLSTGGEDTQESLLTYTNISLEGTVSMVVTNEEVQAQLTKWKKSAVLGSHIVCVAAIVLALLIMLTTIILMAFGSNAWNVSHVVCAVYTVLASCMIVILEFRRGDHPNEAAMYCPEGIIRCQKQLRRLVVRQFRLFLSVWGRGCLYVYTGTIALTLNMFVVWVPAAFLILLGCVAVALGSYAFVRLEGLESALMDESVLKETFQLKDHDRDGEINLKEFGSLMWYLGLDLNKTKLQHIFGSIDVQRRRKISYLQFKTWWYGDGTFPTSSKVQPMDRRYVLSPSPSFRTPQRRQSLSANHTNKSVQQTNPNPNVRVLV